MKYTKTSPEVKELRPLCSYLSVDTIIDMLNEGCTYEDILAADDMVEEDYRYDAESDQRFEMLASLDIEGGELYE